MAFRILRSVATRRFWDKFAALPPDVQTLAHRAYAIWLKDPQHPSLRFRVLAGSSNRVSVRVGIHYRVLGRIEGDTITWVWIGSHAEYDRLVQSK
ncbi:MAG: hypothetical protein ABIR70_17200 [Bryobacteraceae bacterium]